MKALADVYPRAPDRETQIAEAILDRKIVHVPDLRTAGVPEQSLKLASALGYQSILAVPMLKDGAAIGAIAIVRQTTDPFSEQQINLVQSFADQAVIAINNVSLFNELQARTKELLQALESQTATSDVLEIISRNPTKLQPVLDTIAQKAAKLTDATWSAVTRFDGSKIHLSALFNVYGQTEIDEIRKIFPREPNPNGAVDRAILEREVAYLPRLRKDETFPHQAVADATGTESFLAVPMVRAGEALGAVAVGAQVQHAFGERQINLLRSFADQAVIAINNVSLFEELQARQRDLARSVEEMRSLADVGRTVSSSLDMAEVLSTILQHACRISDTSGGTIYVFDKASGTFRVEAAHNMLDEHLERVRAHPMRIGDAVVGECVEMREAVQVPDLAQLDPTRSPLIAILMRGGTRALLAVPLLHQGEVLGALVVRRGRPGLFAPDTVRLLEAFAAQSAIAINNALLFNEVREKGRELELASRHKSQFVANMSHELRTPLAAVLGYAELMREGIFGDLPAEAMGTIERIQSNGKHLLGLINAVLDMSKIEAGQFDLQPVDYSVPSLIETVKVATESLARAKGLRLVTEVTAGMPIGYGDEPRLAQVLLNLVGNAIKFTDKGEVRIRGDVTEDRFLIDVVDTGPGIPEAELGRIFEEFHQVDSSSTKAKGGTGLGLTIAKRIVELHGGTIGVTSQLGVGSTFRLELPIRASAL